jgi:hypothetical protein
LKSADFHGRGKAVTENLGLFCGKNEKYDVLNLNAFFVTLSG